MGIPWTLVWQGVGIIGAGYGLFAVDCSGPRGQRRRGRRVRDEAKVVGRWHDNRHTLVTELAESGAGDEVIMSIAGHVSRAMLSRYSHVRMEAKRRALDEIAARQIEADDKRHKEEQQQQAAMVSHAELVQ